MEGSQVTCTLQDVGMRNNGSARSDEYPIGGYTTIPPV
jgi:hypothetical protein